MRTVSLLALLVLVGCNGATFDEVYGRPDATEWTYFEGAAADVVEAIQAAYAGTDLVVEGIGSEAEGTVITLSLRSGSPDLVQYLVQATETQGFSSRVQTYPVARPIPRWLEIDVSGRL